MVGYLRPEGKVGNIISGARVTRAKQESRAIIPLYNLWIPGSRRGLS